MSSESHPEQLSIFDGPCPDATLDEDGEVVWSEADTDSWRRLADQHGHATAAEYLTISRLELDQAVKQRARAALDSRPVTWVATWNRQRRNPRRSHPPRQAVPAAMREAIVADAGRRCQIDGRDGNESSLQIGHCLTLADAWDLTMAFGDSGPWRVANNPENLFAQCERCNLGQGPDSQPATVAGDILMAPRLGKRRLSFDAGAEVVRWCRIIDQLRRGEEPGDTLRDHR